MAEGMCHDCPHHREHEIGDVMATVNIGRKNKPHPCHNNPSASCRGHVQQLRKIALNIVQPEDYPEHHVYDESGMKVKAFGQ